MQPSDFLASLSATLRWEGEGEKPALPKVIVIKVAEDSIFLGLFATEDDADWLRQNINLHLNNEFDEVLLDFSGVKIENTAWEQLLSDIEWNGFTDKIDFIGLTEPWEGLLSTWRFSMNPNTITVDVRDEVNLGKAPFGEMDAYSVLDFVEILLECEGEGEMCPILLDFTGFEDDQVEYEAAYLLISELDYEYQLAQFDFKGRQTSLVEAVTDYMVEIENDFDDEEEIDLCELGLCDCDIEIEDEDDICDCDECLGLDEDCEDECDFCLNDIELCDCDELEEDFDCDCCDCDCYDEVEVDAYEDMANFQGEEFIITGLGVYNFVDDGEEDGSDETIYYINPELNLLED